MRKREKEENFKRKEESRNQGTGEGEKVKQENRKKKETKDARNSMQKQPGSHRWLVGWLMATVLYLRTP